MGRILNARKRDLVSVITDINLVITGNCTKLNVTVSRRTEADAKSIYPALL